MEAIFILIKIFLTISPSWIAAHTVVNLDTTIQPCTYSTSTIDCRDRNLTTFPAFKETNISVYNLYIYMQNNFLKFIPENAFENLTLAKNTNVLLYLSGNNLSQIATNAFKNIAEHVVFVSLDNNDFTDIPNELAELPNIQTLYLWRNPITSLDKVTVEALGKHLNEFYFDMHLFRQWPDQMKYLTNLTELDIYNLNLTKLEINAFNGFEKTLQTLSIQNSNLTQVPAAICQLQQMNFFEFMDNTNVNDGKSLFEPCDKKMTSVLYVTLSGNDLTEMPPVFQIFPNTNSLFMYNNNLSSIPSDYIPAGTPLKYLSLENNNFRRIPNAFINLESVTQLQFGYNNLKSIETDDLSCMIRLQYLFLYHNPIEYIASAAFRNNKNLYTIALQNTRLQNLPASLAELHNLHYLTLGEDPIHCSCKMDYLKQWNVSFVNMDGHCKGTSVAIKTFLMKDLPKCL